MAIAKVPVALTVPGNPPAQYDQRYMQELVASVRTMIQALANYPVMTASQITLSDQPAETTGLPLGTIYLKTLASGEKVLSIVLLGDPH